MAPNPSGYYYFGGYDMNAKEIKVLMAEPGKHSEGEVVFNAPRISL